MTEREDVGTTPRKPLTPTQRLKMFEEHKGICALCKRLIVPGDDWIDEHMRALGLGGSNDPSNRAPVHVACAEAKTRGDDIPRIAKAKRQKRAALGIKPDGANKIQSKGFDHYEKPPKAGKARIDKSALPQLPPRKLYA